MERLTERHYKASDGYYMKCSGTCGEGCCDGCPKGDEFVDRLGQIEDVLGDTYDLDRLRELVEADKNGRCVVLPVKIGDRVYTVFPLSLKREAKVEKIEIDEHGVFLRGKYPSIFDGDAFIPANVFGTYAFTKEAEAKKAERQQIEAFLAKEADHE